MNHPPSVKKARDHIGWILAAAAAVLLWRAAALRWPSSFIVLPDELRLPIGLLGVLFVACGVWAWWVRPGRWTQVFLLYGLGGGVHWGGSVGAESEGLALSLLFVYLACSVLAETALLHLALIYPHGRPLGKWWRAELYAPAAFALLLAAAAGVLPRTLLETLIGLLLLVANLFSVVAGILFLVRLVRADAAARHAARLPLIVAGLIAGTALSLLGSGGVLPGNPEAWNLALGIVPICLAVALTTHTCEAPAA